jgi:homoserine kinase
MAWSPAAVQVRVPATSANLGPGFDALGLALTLHDDVTAWTSASGLSIEISGEGADLAAAGEEHLVVRAMRAAFAVTGGQPPGLGLRCVNRIPHGRGLGSSAAAVVAGLLAARALAACGPVGSGGDAPAGLAACRGGPESPRAFGGPVGSGGDAPAGLAACGGGPEPPRACGGPEALPDDALLRMASALEGHPDNVAACLGGGLTIAWTAGSGLPGAVRLEPLPSIVPVICVAPAPVRTDVARGLLPGMVPHKDAAASAGRSALLVAALTQPADAGVLFDATQDWLHQDYRAAAMPETSALVGRLRGQRIPAVVSGAGPSVLALLTRGSDYGRDLDTLGSIVRETGIAWHISSLQVERQGARVLLPEPPPG